MESLEFEDDTQFSELSNDTEALTKPEVMGNKLWSKLFERDQKFGGVTCAFYGIPGSGKTSLMLKICKKIAEDKPDEVIFWREPEGVPMQITNLGVPVNFFSSSKMNIKIHELKQEGYVDSKEHRVYSFRNEGELLKRVTPGINCVYFHDRKGWLRLIRRMKTNLSWQSFFLDECEDIFSSRVGGADWHLNEEFCQDIKELRKTKVSMYLNSQTDWDVDPRIKSKLMLECFLYGSKRDSNNPLYKGVLQDVKLGEGWIVYAHSIFGKIRFGPVEPSEKQFIAISHRKR